MKVQSNISLAHNNHFADDAKRNNTLIYYIALLKQCSFYNKNTLWRVIA